MDTQKGARLYRREPDTSHPYGVAPVYGVGGPSCTYHGGFAEICPDHGCPECFLENIGKGECETCDRLDYQRFAAEWPEAIPDPATGHDGEDCIHCRVCGKCQGTGDVCHWCQRCTEHEFETGAQCDPFCCCDLFPEDEPPCRCSPDYDWGNDDAPLCLCAIPVWTHSFFDKTTRGWS